MSITIGKNPPLNKQVESLQSQVDKLIDELESQNKDKTQYENQNFYLQEEIQKARETINQENFEKNKFKNEKTELEKKLKAVEEKNQNLQKIIEGQEKEIQKLANEKTGLENKRNEKWSWDKFFIGLSQFGITESTLVSVGVLALTQMIEYLELLNLGNNTGWVVLSSLLIIVFKSTKQILKEKNKTK